MKIYHIRQTQFLPVTLTAAWDFFSDPRNLGEITPSQMKFRIISNSHPGRMEAGQMIRYKIQIVPAISTNWLTQITDVQFQKTFTDDQLEGPYAVWKHKHSFKQVSGGVEMTDEVNYAIPLGWIGRIAQHLLVGPRLKAIFAHRRHVLEQKFKLHPTQDIISNER